MSWTKGELVSEAYNELGLQGYIFNVGPDERETALKRLDTMMATWNGKGIRLGYPLPSTANGSSLEQDSAIPDWSIEAVYLNLAVRLSAGFGKQIPPTTASTAKDAYNVVLQQLAMPPEQRMPSTMPKGAGNRRWAGAFGEINPFFPTPVDPLLAGQDGEITFT
jgi:hypothetical protein